MTSMKHFQLYLQITSKNEFINYINFSFKTQSFYSYKRRKSLTMIKSIFNFFNKIFKKKKNIKLGLYGPPNGGKTTLANKICADWLGEEMGLVSHIPHETREVQVKEQVTVRSGNREISFNLADTPGIATKIDYEDFIKAGIATKESKKRAKEATKGVIDAIKWLDEMDVVIVVLDSTKNPYSQVNITIIGNLEARKIPVIIAANKIDLKRSNIKKIEQAFPQYKVISISAKLGNNMEDLYNSIIQIAK